MKILAFIIFGTFYLFTASAQEVTSVNVPVDEASGLITYKEVVNEPGSKDTLFNRCSTWLHTFYPNPWDATKVRDQSTGLIKIQHQFRIYDTDESGNKLDAGMVLYSARIEFKEGRYRVVVDNFVWKLVSRYPAEKWLDVKAADYDPKYKDYLAQIDSFVNNELFRTLNEKMKPAKQVKEEDW